MPESKGLMFCLLIFTEATQRLERSLTQKAIIRTGAIPERFLIDLFQQNSHDTSLTSSNMLWELFLKPVDSRFRREKGNKTMKFIRALSNIQKWKSVTQIYSSPQTKRINCTHLQVFTYKNFSTAVSIWIVFICVK